MLYGRFVCFSHICLFFHSFISVKDSWILHLDYNSVLLFIVFHSNCSSCKHWKLSGWFHVPLIYCHHYVFGALLFFLVVEDAPGSSCIFPALVLQSAISPRSCDLFYWRMKFRNMDLGT